jgi:hypothetical protein
MLHDTHICMGYLSAIQGECLDKHTALLSTVLSVVQINCQRAVGEWVVPPLSPLPPHMWVMCDDGYAQHEALRGVSYI